MTYIGGKNAAGVAQRIINNMPPHDCYIEGFLGSGAVMRKKRPARTNIGFDLSQQAIDICIENMSIELAKECRIIRSNFIDQLFKDHITDQTLVYLDPPYLMSTRKSGKLYEYELCDDDHLKLLKWAKTAKCMVMISGYASDLYDEHLADFTSIKYKAQTRQGMVDEVLWMNFKQPDKLHDYRFLGNDYRERERIRKKAVRFKNKFANMPRLERLAILSTLENSGA